MRRLRLSGSLYQFNDGHMARASRWCLLLHQSEYTIEWLYNRRPTAKINLQLHTDNNNCEQSSKRANSCHFQNIHLFVDTTHLSRAIEARARTHTSNETKSDKRRKHLPLNLMSLYGRSLRHTVFWLTRKSSNQ